MISENVEGPVQYQKGWSVVNATLTSQVRKANHLLL